MQLQLSFVALAAAIALRSTSVLSLPLTHTHASSLQTAKHTADKLEAETHIVQARGTTEPTRGIEYDADFKPREPAITEEIGDLETRELDETDELEAREFDDTEELDAREPEPEDLDELDARGLDDLDDLEARSTGNTSTSPKPPAPVVKSASPVLKVHPHPDTPKKHDVAPSSPKNKQMIAQDSASSPHQPSPPPHHQAKDNVAVKLPGKQEKAKEAAILKAKTSKADGKHGDSVTTTKSKHINPEGKGDAATKHVNSPSRSSEKGSSADSKAKEKLGPAAAVKKGNKSPKLVSGESKTVEGPHATVRATVGKKISFDGARSGSKSKQAKGPKHLNSPAQHGPQHKLNNQQQHHFGTAESDVHHHRHRHHRHHHPHGEKADHKHPQHGQHEHSEHHSRSHHDHEYHVHDQSKSSPAEPSPRAHAGSHFGNGAHRVGGSRFGHEGHLRFGSTRSGSVW
jgi:hypothetical protein